MILSNGFNWNNVQVDEVKNSTEDTAQSHGFYIVFIVTIGIIVV